MIQAVVNNSPLALSYYNNILSTLFLAPMVLLAGELPGTVELFAGRDKSTFLWGVVVTVSFDARHLMTLMLSCEQCFPEADRPFQGFFGFLISLAAMLSIKVTSPVTHSMSSASARSVYRPC